MKFFDYTNVKNNISYFINFDNNSATLWFLKSDFIINVYGVQPLYLDLKSLLSNKSLKIYVK